MLMQKGHWPERARGSCRLQREHVEVANPFACAIGKKQSGQRYPAARGITSLQLLQRWRREEAVIVLTRVKNGGEANGPMRARSEMRTACYGVSILSPGQPSAVVKTLMVGIMFNFLLFRVDRVG